MSSTYRGLAAELQAALPRKGLFQGRTWRWSDQPLHLEAVDLKFLESLGKKIGAFLRAANRLYRVLRPDLIRTEEGWALTEIDSVPGGVGLTAWMQENYSKGGHAVLGGPSGLRNLAERILGESGEVVISREAQDYRPEWSWLVGDARVNPFWLET